VIVETLGINELFMKEHYVLRW